MAGHMDRRTRGREREYPHVGRTFWPLLAICPLPIPSSASLGWQLGRPTHLGLWGRIAGLTEDHDPGTFTCSRGSLGHQDRPRVSVTLHRPGSRRAEQTHGKGLASRTRLPSAVSLGLGAAQWPERPKERKEEEMKTRWLKYSVSLGVG